MATYVVASRPLERQPTGTPTTHAKNLVQRVTSCIFQVYPSLLALIVPTERVTNSNNQWDPPSLLKERQIHVLRVSVIPDDFLVP